MPQSQAEADLAASETADRKVISEIYCDDELNKMLHTSEKSLSVKDKMAGFGAFMKLLSDPVNARVARVFLVVSSLMVVVPLTALFVGMHVIAPVVDMDGGTCGGVLAVVAVVAVMSSYVVFVLNDEVFNEKKQQVSVAQGSGEARAVNKGEKTSGGHNGTVLTKREKPAGRKK